MIKKLLIILCLASSAQGSLSNSIFGKDHPFNSDPFFTNAHAQFNQLSNLQNSSNEKSNESIGNGESEDDCTCNITISRAPCLPSACYNEKSCISQYCPVSTSVNTIGCGAMTTCLSCGSNFCQSKSEKQCGICLGLCCIPCSVPGALLISPFYFIASVFAALGDAACMPCKLLNKNTEG